jgi:hypothetical protein
VLALSVSDLRPPGLSQASESRSRWASPYCDVKTRARVVLPEPELPNTTMRRITLETDVMGPPNEIYMEFFRIFLRNYSVSSACLLGRSTTKAESSEIPFTEKSEATQGKNWRALWTSFGPHWLTFWPAKPSRNRRAESYQVLHGRRRFGVIALIA